MVNLGGCGKGPGLGRQVDPGRGTVPLPGGALHFQTGEDNPAPEGYCNSRDNVFKLSKGRREKPRLLALSACEGRIGRGGSGTWVQVWLSHYQPPGVGYFFSRGLRLQCSKLG